MNTASFRCSVRIRGGIPRDLEGRGGDSCPTRLRGSELLLSTPCCIGSRRGGRIGCRGRVGACGRLRVWRPRPGCASVCEVGYRTTARPYSTVRVVLAGYIRYVLLRYSVYQYQVPGNSYTSYERVLSSCLHLSLVKVGP